MEIATKEPVETRVSTANLALPPEKRVIPIKELGLRGRGKNSAKEKTLYWKDFAEYCLSKGLYKFSTELDKLNGVRYINAFMQVLAYLKPRAASLDEPGKTEQYYTVNILDFGKYAAELAASQANARSQQTAGQTVETDVSANGSVPENEGDRTPVQDSGEPVKQSQNPGSEEGSGPAGGADGKGDQIPPI